VGLGPAGVAVSPRTGKIYVLNFTVGTVSVISGRTGAVTSTIATTAASYEVAVSPQTGKIYVTDFIDETVSVLG
jgi:DNA-binding beta-propeller fold protein YncE